MRKARGRTRYLTPDEEARLLAGLPEGVKHDTAVFLLDTGARVNEALGLTWEDLVHHPALDRVTFFRTKSGRARTVPLTARAQQVLQQARTEGRHRPFPVRYHAFWVAFTKAKIAAGLSVGEPVVNVQVRPVATASGSSRLATVGSSVTA